MTGDIAKIFETYDFCDESETLNNNLLDIWSS
jgi:hypothetical protein